MVSMKKNEFVFALPKCYICFFKPNPMKRFLSALVLIGLSLATLHAQTDEPKRQKGVRSSSNSFYINVLGPSIPGSINYERIWTKNGVVNIGTKIGGFFISLPKVDELTIANGTAECTFLFGRSAHMFEMGIGWAGHYGNYFSEDEGKTKHYAVPTSTFSMHYRYQKPKGGVFFHVGFTGSSILMFGSTDLVELAAGNAAIYGFKGLTGEKPSFSLFSIGIGASF